MKGLHDREHTGNVLDVHASVFGNVLRRGLQKPRVIDIADDEFRHLAITCLEIADLDLLEEMLLERFLFHE